MLFEHLDYTWEDLSISKIIKKHHNQFILPIITIFAGLTLFLNKKIGWLTSVVSSSTISITQILLPWTTDIEDIENEKLIYVLAGIFSLAFIVISGLLLTKKIREKYNPTNKTWLIMFLLVVLLVADKILIK